MEEELKIVYYKWDTSKKGDVLAVIENLADTEDMLRLRQCLANWQDTGARVEKLDMIFSPITKIRKRPRGIFHLLVVLEQLSSTYE